MKKTLIKFEEVEKAIEFKGKVYDIPPRTNRTESALKEWSDHNRTTVPLFEAYLEVFTILFGVNSAIEIVGDEESCNLDIMSKIYNVSMELYYEEKVRQDQEKIKRQFNEIHPSLVSVEKAANILSKADEFGRH